MIASGGISPNGWTNVLTLVLVMAWFFTYLGGDTSILHPERQSGMNPESTYEFTVSA
jgi:hypothetical protein